MIKGRHKFIGVQIIAVKVCCTKNWNKAWQLDPSAASGRNVTLWMIGKNPGVWTLVMGF